MHGGRVAWAEEMEDEVVPVIGAFDAVADGVQLVIVVYAECLVVLFEHAFSVIDDVRVRLSRVYVSEGTSREEIYVPG